MESMLDFYKNYENLFSDAEKLEIPSVKKTPNVFYTGMGGSGAAGDMVQLLEPKFHYEVLRNLPSVPYQVNEDSLVIAVSYSGNTKETIRTFKNALKKGATGVVIASGGYLEQYSRDNSIPLIKVPTGLQPRVAFPMLLVPLFRLLNETFEMGYNIHELCEGVVESKEDATAAQELAEIINGKIPVIYASKYLPIAKRFKQEINENAKYPAFYSEIPEVYHNEVESYKREMGLFPILIREDSLDDVINEVIKPYIIKPKFGSILKNISSLVYFADLVSIHLANKIGEDPYPVDMITKVKKKTNEII
jgi:glucose/mannose-6-phosphate isomerase